MKKPKKKPKIDPTDFPKIEALFQPVVAQLTVIDHDEAATGYLELGIRAYRYGNSVMRVDGAQALCAYLCQRDRLPAVFDMNVFELSLQLAMPQKYPPLTMAMRRSLGLKLAYGKKLNLAVDELADFIAKPLPARKMKEALGLAKPSSHGRPMSGSGSLKLRGPARPKHKPHRLANSASYKAHKAEARRLSRLRLKADEG